MSLLWHVRGRCDPEAMIVGHIVLVLDLPVWIHVAEGAPNVAQGVAGLGAGRGAAAVPEGVASELVLGVELLLDHLVMHCHLGSRGDQG